MLYVADERTKQSLAGYYYDTLTKKQKAGIESVFMDMWPAYINATLAHIPNGREDDPRIGGMGIDLSKETAAMRPRRGGAFPGG